MLSVKDKKIDNLLQDNEALRLQQVTYIPLHSPSPPGVSEGTQGQHAHGVQDHPTTHDYAVADKTRDSWDRGTDSHKTIREERNFGGLTVQELSALREQKKLLKNDKNNVETELAAECLVKEDALRGKESALEEERKNLSVIISQLKEENDALRNILRRSSGPGERLRGAK